MKASALHRLRKVGILIVAIVTLAITGLAQEPTSPPAAPIPAPTPAVKRRTFDQFDLSDVVRLGSAPMSQGPASSAVVEQVDQQTYDGIARMVKYAADTSSEYRSAAGVTTDTSNFFEPNRVLLRKLPALFRITEIYRSGLLDEVPLKSPPNATLLARSQEIISEMVMIANSTDAQFLRNQPKLVPLAEKYGAPTDPVEKRPLLMAMFGRLNETFTLLLSRVALKN
jgi:hypothetical protein